MASKRGTRYHNSVCPSHSCTKSKRLHLRADFTGAQEVTLCRLAPLLTTLSDPQEAFQRSYRVFVTLTVKTLNCVISKSFNSMSK